MRQLTKIMLCSLLFCLLVVIITAAIIAITIEPNDYKTQIADFVKSKIGRDVSLEGDIELALFPPVTLKTQRIVIDNTADFKPDPFLTLNKSEIHLNAWALLKRKIEIAGIDLTDLTVNLVVNKLGLRNWSDFGAETTQSTINGNSSVIPEFLSSSLGPVNIYNGRINWNDRKSDTQIAFTTIQFNSGPINIGKPAAVHVSLIVSYPHIKSETNLKFDTFLCFDTMLDHFVFNDSLLDYKGYNPFPSGGPLNAQLSMHEIDIKRSIQSINITGLQLAMTGIKLSADLQGETIIDKPEIRSTIKVEPFNPKAVIKEWGFPFPALTNPNALTNLSMDLDVQATMDAADIYHINLKFDNSRIDGSVSVKNFRKPSILFDLAVDKIDLDEYKTLKDSNASRSDFNVTRFTNYLNQSKNFDANGQLRVDRLTYNHTLFEGIYFTLNSKNGIVTEQRNGQNRPKLSMQ
ncbi:MAG: AsmA family protein [Methylococcaceae bacterium]|nr:AsmA family protein [Methylococcaceae bacterium]